MRRHFTVTGNLLAETTGYYERIRAGSTHRARRDSFQVGGKGINVAKVSQRMGRPTTAIHFASGETGRRCERWLAKQGYDHRSIEMSSGETREGWVVRTEDGTETTFLGADRPVELPAWEAALQVVGACEGGCLLSIAGSIPGWVEAMARPLEDLLAIEPRGRHFIGLDTYGPPLKSLAHLSIDLLKINLRELQTLTECGDDEAAVLAALCSDRIGARYRVVTNGPGAVHAVDTKEGLRLRITPPRIDEVSPVGSGDVVMAVLMHHLADETPLQAALCHALACGARNAAEPGLAEFDPGEVAPLDSDSAQVV